MNQDNCRKRKTCIASTCSDCVLYMPNKKPFRINLAVILGQAPPQPDLRPLMLHTITKGGSAKVVYLERWEDSTSLCSNTDFEIVWPASASQGYIDYMLEHSAGEIADTFRLVGYWIKEKHIERR